MEYNINLQSHSFITQEYIYIYIYFNFNFNPINK